MIVRAVLFDLDNTLTHRNLSIEAYTTSLINHYQHDLDQYRFEQVLNIIHRIDNGGYPKKELLTYPSIGASVADALLKELDWEKQPSLELLTQFWFDQFGRHAVAFPDAENVLKELSRQNYKLAVVSNGGHATRLSILDGLGFSHYFDEIISSEKVGLSKPRPEIFLHTSQLLNVQPEECLFIGDHPINDVQGAHGAGMHAILLEGFHKPTIEIQHKIQKLTQIFNYIEI